MESPLDQLMPGRDASWNPSEGVYSVNRARHCTFISAAAAALLGGEPHDFLGHDMARVHQRGEPATPSACGCPILASMTRNEQRQVTNDQLYRLDGSAFAADWSVYPIVDDGRVSGALVTFSDRDGRERETAALYQQAREAAASNARHQARARALANAGRVFAEVSLDYHAALDAAVREISLLYNDICIIRVVSDDGLWLNPVAFYHPDPAMRAYFAERASITPYRMNEGLLGQAAVNGETILINDWGRNAPELAIPPNVPIVLEPQRFDIQAVMAVPLRAQGRPLGVLSVWRDRPDEPYNEDDLTFLIDLGNRAALAVENGRLYKEMIDRERRYREMLERVLPGRITPRGNQLAAPALTPRELEVLQLLARGLTNQEIAGELAVSRSTAKAHVEHIIAKLAVTSRTEAAVRATEIGLLHGRASRSNASG